MTKKPKIARTRATGELHTNLTEMTDAIVVQQLKQSILLYGSNDANTVDHVQAAMELHKQIYNALYKFHLKLERMA